MIIMIIIRRWQHANSTTRGLDRSLLLSLSHGDWIRQHLNIIITGATGVGKTYLASALGYCACEQDFSVRYYRTSRLLNDIATSHADGTWGKRLDSLARMRLLILDDWLRDRLTPDQLRNMLEIFDDNSYSIDMKGDSRRKQLAKEKKKKMEEIQVQGGKNK